MRLSGLVPLLALAALGVFLAGHLLGWDVMPSSAPPLVGPASDSVTTAAMSARIDGRLDVGLGQTGFLYSAEPIRTGGDIGLPEAVERTQGTIDRGGPGAGRGPRALHLCWMEPGAGSFAGLGAVPGRRVVGRPLGVPGDRAPGGGSRARCGWAHPMAETPVSVSGDFEITVPGGCGGAGGWGCGGARGLDRDCRWMGISGRRRRMGGLGVRRVDPGDHRAASYTPRIVPSDRLKRLALIVWTAVGVLALGYVFLYIAGSVRVIWLPIAFAAGLVFLLEPMVRVFQRMRMPRVLAVILSFLVVVAVILAVAALVLPTIRVQAQELGKQLPDLYLSGIDWLREAGAKVGVNIDDVLSQQAIEDWLNDPANQETVQNLLLGFGAGAGQVIRGVTEAFAVLVLAPVLAIYILIDLERFKASSLGMTPPRHREETAFVAGEVSTAMGSFVRGQFLVALIVGIASSFGMWLIDLPFWLIIGILAGFLNLIPFLGPVVGGALAALVALLNGDVTQAIWAVVIFVGDPTGGQPRDHPSRATSPGESLTSGHHPRSDHRWLGRRVCWVSWWRCR